MHQSIYKEKMFFFITLIFLGLLEIFSHGMQSVKENVYRNIAILGWGSLVNFPLNLEIEGKFQKVGMTFPIELSTVSFPKTIKQKLTRIIDKHWGHPISLWYVNAKNRSLSRAIENLAKREYTSDDNIFYVKTLFEGEQCTKEEKLISNNGTPLIDKNNRLWCINKKAAERLPLAKIIELIEWATLKQYDAVIWTGLAMVEEYDRDELINLLRKDPRTLRNTKEYIINYSPDLAELTQFEKNILADDL